MEQTPNPAECATCGTEMLGNYCHSCGEKQLLPAHDFSVKHFLAETLEGLTHLDNRLIRSFRYLFQKPGFLTSEFTAGRRVRYLKPIPLFIISGVLFYFFFSNATAFYSNVENLSEGYENGNRISNTFQVNTQAILDAKAAEFGKDKKQLWQELSKEASNRSKTWLFLIAPVWGIILWGLFYRKNNWLVPHLVFALHCLAFFVLSELVLLILLVNIFQVEYIGDGYFLFLSILFGGYCTIAIRKCYGLNGWATVRSGLMALLSFLVVLLLYRQLITIWTISVAQPASI